MRREKRARSSEGEAPIPDRELYEILHAHVAEVPIDDRVRIRHFLDFIGDLSGGKLLDVACGRGEFLNELQSRTAVGLDIVETPFLGEYYKYVCGDARELPFRNDSFDVVTGFDIIEHLSARGAAGMLREMGRVLKEGGRLYVSTPNKYSVFNFILDGVKDNRLIRKFIGRPVYAKNCKQHIVIYSCRRLVDSLRGYGFEVSRCYKMRIGFSVLFTPFFYSGRFQIKKLFPIFTLIFHLDWALGRLLRWIPNIHFDYMFELKRDKEKP